MSRRIGAPSMFHRRLAWLAVLMVGAIVALGGQVARLTVMQGPAMLAKAERALERRRVLPTYRGRILDRRDRVLAVDEPGYALAVQYRVITGEWIDRTARELGQDEVGRGVWRELTAKQQAAAATRHRPTAVLQHDRMWAEIARLTGVPPDDLAERADGIVARVERIEADVYKKQREEQAATYGSDTNFTPRPLVEHLQAHVLVPAIEDRVAYDLRGLSTALPGMLEVVEERRRIYPWQTAEVIVERDTLPRPLASPRSIAIQVEGIADHILGTMRDVRAEDVRRRPFRDGDDATRDLGGYRSIDDRAGAWGIENTFEDLLRGERGVIRERASTGVTERTDPVAGRDVVLTIDVALQARIQALMSRDVGLMTVHPFQQNRSTVPAGISFNGAAVVVEVETGEMLAMVSLPTLADGRAARAVDPLRDYIDHPVVNRPVEGVYPPGSIIKPLVLAAGIGEGVQALEDPIACTGHYFPNSLRPRCWIYRDKWNLQTHGALVAADAIGQSCNIYFYTLADRLGIGRLTQWLDRFGLGAPLDVGLLRDHQFEDANGDLQTQQIGELGGKLLSPAEIAAISPANRRFARVTFGIGQGECVLWTPVQAANAFATIARGGVVRDATLVAGDPRGSRTPRPDVPIAPAVLDAILTGLNRSVSAGGTGYQISYEPGDAEPIFNAPGVKVWGKTGTAQAPPLRLADTNDDGVIDVKDANPLLELDHAWFVGLVGPEDTGRPMFVIAVLVEYGGSGGRVAGPIANQIIHALQAEDYLPSVALESGSP